MKIPIWLNNLVARIDVYFTREPYLANRDGRLVPIDEWDGYDCCMRPGCGHYHAEHSFGETRITEYVDPKLKNPNFQVGDVVSWPEGCMNAGCKCPGFWTESQLIEFIQNITYARVNGSWELRQVPGVTHVESGIAISVWIDTYTESKDEAARDAIYEVERVLHNEYPIALFNFNTRWSKPPKD